MGGKWEWMKVMENLLTNDSPQRSYPGSHFLCAGDDHFSVIRRGDFYRKKRGGVGDRGLAYDDYRLSRQPLLHLVSSYGN